MIDHGSRAMPANAGAVSGPPTITRPLPTMALFTPTSTWRQVECVQTAMQVAPRPSSPPARDVPRQTVSKITVAPRSASATEQIQRLQRHMFADGTTTTR